MSGYSDRINHALAFAAKHHDQQVRKGTRAPYFTQPANVAIILTRYGRGEDEVVAGVLYGLIEDCVREGYSPEMLEQRIGEKFGMAMLQCVMAVALRRTDDDGVELGGDDRREDFLLRLARADESAKWVCAADKLHGAASLAADLKRTVDPDAVWGRTGAGKLGTVRFQRAICDALATSGFAAPILDEYRAVVGQLEGYAGL